MAESNCMPCDQPQDLNVNHSIDIRTDMLNKLQVCSLFECEKITQKAQFEKSTTLQFVANCVA